MEGLENGAFKIGGFFFFLCGCFDFFLCGVIIMFLHTKKLDGDFCLCSSPPPSPFRLAWLGLAFTFRES